MKFDYDSDENKFTDQFIIERSEVPKLKDQIAVLKMAMKGKNMRKIKPEEVFCIVTETKKYFPVEFRTLEKEEMKAKFEFECTPKVREVWEKITEEINQRIETGNE
jgi:hypothetical protein